MRINITVISHWHLDPRLVHLYHLAVGGLYRTKRTHVYHSLFTHRAGASCRTESTAGTVSCTSGLEWLKNIPFRKMAWVYTVLVYTQETWPDLWVQCYFFLCYTDPYCQELAAAQKAQQAEWIGWVSEIDGFKTWTKRLYSVTILSCQNKEYTVYWYVFPGTRGIRLTIECSLHFFKCRRKQGEESLLRRLCFCQDLLKKKRLQEMNDMASTMPSEIDVFFHRDWGQLGDLEVLTTAMKNQNKSDTYPKSDASKAFISTSTTYLCERRQTTAYG